MINHILVAIWFFLPAAAANVTPIFLAKIMGSRFNTPIDFNKTWRGKPIFGRNKTWRGLIGGIFVATLVLWLQITWSENPGWAGSLFDEIGYHRVNVWLIGPLFAIGALGGDAIESFIKRRIGKKSGDPWFPFDQIDYVIGASLITLPLVELPWYLYIYILVIWSFISLVSSWLGHKMKLKDVPH